MCIPAALGLGAQMRRQETVASFFFLLNFFEESLRLSFLGLLRQVTTNRAA